MRRRTFVGRGLAPLLVAGVMGHARRGWAAAPAPPTLVVLAHPDIPVTTLSREELAAIFMREVRLWKGVALRPMNLPPKMPERVLFDQVVLRLSPDQSAQVWIDKLVRGEGDPPRKIPSAQVVSRIVEKLPGAIAYAPEALVGDAKVRRVAIIRGGEVMKP